MDYQEFSAKSLNDAITEACQALNVPSARLDYEVVEEGSSGFLGLGSKPAVIKARVKDENENAAPAESAKPVEEKRANVEKSDSSRADKKNLSSQEVTDIAMNFLEEVFKAMDMEVTMEAAYDEAERDLEVELSGEEMGILIGKRGATLDSLQYLVSLVVNKDSQDYIRVKLDTENYRERRRETLENLAKNVASKVKRNGQNYALEPMNPYERRIIHSALQGNKYVETFSEGEEPNRHVVVKLKDGVQAGDFDRNRRNGRGRRY